MCIYRCVWLYGCWYGCACVCVCVCVYAYAQHFRTRRLVMKRYSFFMLYQELLLHCKETYRYVMPKMLA